MIFVDVLQVRSHLQPLVMQRSENGRLQLLVGIVADKDVLITAAGPTALHVHGHGIVPSVLGGDDAKDARCCWQRLRRLELNIVWQQQQRQHAEQQENG